MGLGGRADLRRGLFTKGNSETIFLAPEGAFELPKVKIGYFIHAEPQ